MKSLFFALLCLLVTIPCQAHATQIYWCEGGWGAGKVSRSNLDGTDKEELLSAATPYMSVALDIGAGKMYLGGRYKIQRANLDGSGVEELITGTSFYDGLSLDLSTGKMYWCNYDFIAPLESSINRANLDGSNVETLITLSGLPIPRNLTLDLEGGKIYWTAIEGTSVSGVYRSNLDGTGVERFVDGGSEALGITLDSENGKIFWADWEGQKIRQANIDGSPIVPVLLTTGGNPEGIMYNDGKVYWSEWNTDRIMRANFDGSNTELVFDTGSNPWGMAIFHEEPYLSISKKRLVRYISEGDPDPNDLTLKIKNLGPGTIGWEIFEDCQWLEVIPVSGEVTAETDEITLQINTNGLYADNYSCQLMISSEQATNSPQIVEVKLFIFSDDTLIVPEEFSTIQAAIDAAVNGDVITVVPGIYAGNGNRDIDFLGKAITLNSANPNDTNLISATTIYCNGSEMEQHRGFDFHSGEDANSVLAGLTITNGYHGGSGGGISCDSSSPKISNCVINWCYADSGGGIAIYGDNSSPIVNNCIIRENNASSQGGGILCFVGRGQTSGNPKIKNCVISGNYGNTGGGIYSDPVVGTMMTNCIVSGNKTYNRGGGFYGFEYNNSSITNCIIIGNKSYGSHGAGSSGFFPLTNCIVWANRSFYPILAENMLPEYSPTYSCVQGGSNGNSCIDSDPCFVEPGYWHQNGTPQDYDDFWVDGDYHLKDNSPCINTGDPNSITEPNETDLDGNPRVVGGRIDMGPYESVIPPIPAEVDIKPQTLNLTSKGILTCFIRLPQEYDVNEIDTAGICLKTEVGEIEALIVSIDEQEQVAITKFSRQAAAAILDAGDQVEITITGQLTDGTIFEGIDSIRVINNKLQIVADFSSHWLQTDDIDSHACKYLDLNQDSVINFVDFAMLDLLLH